jgi:phytanoyl-CoA dioxygenase PhyH
MDVPSFERSQLAGQASYRSQVSVARMTYIDNIVHDGFAVIENVVNTTTLQALEKELAQVDGIGSQRAGKAFGIRNLMNAVPCTRTLANSDCLRSLVEPILGNNAQVVRGIYFDKHTDANWKVAWHQDLTIAVRQKIELDGFSAWSLKAGIVHVQPPLSVLANMLTLRLHLDHTDESNGALRVLIGTHRIGRLNAHQIQACQQQQAPVTCSVRRGGVLAMRPLLLHSSLPSLNPTHRRVLHFEYTAADLPAGLDWFEA